LGETREVGGEGLNYFNLNAFVIPTKPRGERRNPFELLRIMRNHNYYVYILTNDSGTLYIGITNDLERRVSEHEQGLIKGFTKKYQCHKLIYYEHYTDVHNAIAREKQLKNCIRYCHASFS
jgi:putative endonuclease